MRPISVGVKIIRPPKQTANKHTIIGVSTRVSAHSWKAGLKPRWAGVAQRLWNGLPRNDPGFDFPWGHYKNRTSCPSQGTVNGDAVSKWHRCRWDVKHNQPTNQPKLGSGSKVESMCPASLVCSVNGRFTRLMQTERWQKGPLRTSLKRPTCQLDLPWTQCMYTNFAFEKKCLESV